MRNGEILTSSGNNNGNHNAILTIATFSATADFTYNNGKTTGAAVSDKKATTMSVTANSTLKLLKVLPIAILMIPVKISYR